MPAFSSLLLSRLAFSLIRTGANFNHSLISFSTAASVAFAVRWFLRTAPNIKHQSVGLHATKLSKLLNQYHHTSSAWRIQITFILETDVPFHNLDTFQYQKTSPQILKMVMSCSGFKENEAKKHYTLRNCNTKLYVYSEVELTGAIFLVITKKNPSTPA